VASVITFAGNVPPKRSALIFFLSTVVVVLLLLQAATPFRRSISQRYTARGDSYMKEQEFDLAVTEYQRALRYDGNNAEAQSHLTLAQKAPVDIAVAKDFFVQNHVQSVLDRLALAQKPYTDPKEALRVGAQLYQDKEFVYAQYPIQRALLLDADYPEAWQYLSLVDVELGKFDKAYVEKGKAAARRRDALTPKFLNI
jgi:tetratricopeptide (TPR) repeat protein